MAFRNVFRVSKSKEKFVDKIEVSFIWYHGYSITQKQKSIKSLHDEYKRNNNEDNILEISSKSPNELGVKLSAFNLLIKTKDNRVFSVETAFQASKKFENGGPFLDILNKSSKAAKKDERLRNSGKLVSFEFYNTIWPLEPKTLFYDWLYMRALYNQKYLAKEILKYNAFSDIEFNSNKSINCQANAAALFVSLYRRGLLNKAMSSISNYISIVSNSNNSIVVCKKIEKTEIDVQEKENFIKWLTVNSIDELKSLGNLKNVKLMIKSDINTLFNQKESKDKNISEMIKIQSNSWKGLFQKIIAFREVVSYFNNIYDNSKK